MNVDLKGKKRKMGDMNAWINFLVLLLLCFENNLCSILADNTIGMTKVLNGSIFLPKVIFLFSKYRSCHNR